MSENFKRANKSSIIRIIISKFNDKGIKEFKVLYNKQGGVDTFTCETELVNNEIVFKDKSVKPRKREYSDKFPDPSISSDGKSVEITKIVNENETRKYRVEISLNPKNEKEVELKVIDLLENNSEKRKAESSTKRLLLDEDLMERYSQIAQCTKDEIDSQKIYKIKRFLDYRSNMLIYFQFINDFLTKGTDLVNKDNSIEPLEEIWEVVNKKSGIKDESYIESITKNILSNITKGIENQNNKTKKEDNSVYFEEFNKDKLKPDVEKMIYLFSDLRHKIMHYEYEYFEKLFENENPQLKKEKIEEDLEKYLDLNIFSELDKVVELKEENKTNYLSDIDKIELFEKSQNAKQTYRIYNMICNRKNGFNKFINSILIEDGIEDENFKELIVNAFYDSIQRLKNKILEKQEALNGLKNCTEEDAKTLEKKIKRTIKYLESLVEEKNSIIEVMTNEKDKEAFTPYYLDIQQYRKYKRLYNSRKNKSLELSKLIQTGKNLNNKKYITQLNKDCLNLKKQMEKITKINSKIRLEYKMKIVFGFLLKNYSKEVNDKIEIDIEKFMQDKEFLLNNTDHLKENKKEYLQIHSDCMNIQFSIKSIEERFKKRENFLSDNKNDVLARFYVLMYLLLPTEIRGDFLGYVKKHYYDIKNIELIEIPEEESENNQNKNNEDEIIQDEENHSFFHTLRLFEKNCKKYEIIKYRIIDFENLSNDMDRIYEKFGLDVSSLKTIEQQTQGEEKVFSKNIILPLMKYYQMIFKLMNDIEIHALFYYGDNISINWGEKKELSLENTVKKFVKESQLNFSDLMICITQNLPIKKFKDKFAELLESKYKSLYIGDELKEQIAKANDDFKFVYFLRNDIAHLDYNNLFLNPLTGELLDIIKNNKKEKLSFDKSNLSISKRLELLIKEVKQINLEKNILGYNFLNDFYMKKEQFIFNQKQVIMGEVSDSEKEEKNNKEKELLDIYKISNNPKEILLRYFELIKINEKTKIQGNKAISYLDNVVVTFPKEESNKNISKEERTKKVKDMTSVELNSYESNILKTIERNASDLLGIYKKYIIKDIKQKLIALFTKGERRYLTLELYNKTRYNEEYFKRTGGLFLQKEDENDIKIREELRILFEDSLTSQSQIIFKEKSGNEWNNNFEAKYEIVSIKGNNSVISEDELKKMFNEKTQVFQYTSSYEIINPNDKVKKHKSIYTRNILNGVTPKNNKEEEYTGIYNQKIKSLY